MKGEAGSDTICGGIVLGINPGDVVTDLASIGMIRSMPRRLKRMSLNRTKSSSSCSTEFAWARRSMTFAVIPTLTAVSVVRPKRVAAVVAVVSVERAGLTIGVVPADIQRHARPGFRSVGRSSRMAASAAGLW